MLMLLIYKIVYILVCTRIICINAQRGCICGCTLAKRRYHFQQNVYRNPQASDTQPTKSLKFDALRTNALDYNS